MAKVQTTVLALRFSEVLEVLDQRLLPWAERWLPISSAAEAVEAIQQLAVRGAPAIGLVAAYALALEARRNPELEHLKRWGRELASARPTAVNLPKAVASMLELAASCPLQERAERLLQKARSLHQEDAQACLAMATVGANFLKGTQLAVLTHCNAGALATGGVGTALGVVRTLHAQGRLSRLFACETRPVLQGARLTAWEAQKDGIPVTLLVEGAAGSLMASGKVAAVVVGADRIAADGWVANKVGTYPLACLAHRHGVPFLVVAPTSTIDFSCSTGSEIPIELRSPEEVKSFSGRYHAPVGVEAYNPAFDLTPPELVSAIVCERGLVAPVARHTLAKVGS